MNKTALLTARIGMILYIALIVFLCFGHFSQPPQAPRTLLGIETDKIVHFLMFLPFPVLTWLSVGKEPDGPWKALGLVLLIFFCGSLVAAATELGQGFTSYRTTDPKDFLADTAALAIGSLLVFIKMLVKGARSAR
ncbi:MAG: VanZ family protein [Bacteroidales bacterium]|nr:VanZ family protein [Bacteroidales bacterium]